MEKYVKAFTSLRTDKAKTRWSAETKHRAPHKPLLLLAVLDLFDQVAIHSNLIEPSVELGELFIYYWSIVMPPEKGGNMTLPFYHLRSERFWHLQPKQGYENAIRSKITSLVQLQEFVFGAKLDNELYEILLFENNRRLLRMILIETYFSEPFQQALLNQSDINIQSYKYGQKLLDEARQFIDLISDETLEKPIRDQGFRRAVATAYEHRCAFCGVRILTPNNHTAIEASHIIPWSQSHNDSPNNGIALCKLCHWTFDEGMTSINDNYVILVSSIEYRW
jgi:putative restriction endonuclease